MNLPELEQKHTDLLKLLRAAVAGRAAGVLAQRFGGRIEWDAERARITNPPGIERLPERARPQGLGIWQRSVGKKGMNCPRIGTGFAQIPGGGQANRIELTLSAPP